MSSPKGPDPELKKAFADMQSKMIESKQKMAFSDLQIENFKRSITHSQLTITEISTLPESVPVYQSVGRMFVISTPAGVLKDLGNKITFSEEKIKGLESSKEYLSKTLKENEDTLRELVLQKRSLAQ